jgi:hypothetical protein
MALPGMRGTFDFTADQRPQNYREGIMVLAPRNGAPLYALTAAMRSEKVDDPIFHWWEEDLEMYALVIPLAQTAVQTVIPVAGLASRLKPGDNLMVGSSLEVITVTAVTTDTSITVLRAQGMAGTPQGTAAATVVNENLVFIGSGYREGAPLPIATSYNPVKRSNACQIFRDPIEYTRTALATRLRTGDIRKEDRRRALHKHSLGIERAFWFGTMTETLEAGQPKRSTRGVLNSIPAANIQTVQGAGGKSTMDELMSYFPRMFEFGSPEKLGFANLATITALGEIVRKNSMYEWGPSEEEYKMRVRRLHTPSGTLVLAEHPGFNNSALNTSLVVVDTDELKYKYILDTTLLSDREQKGVDGEAEEYITEAGLLIGMPRKHFWLRGLTGGAKDA